MSYTEDMILEIYPENYMTPVSESGFMIISLACLAAFMYTERERIWRYLFYSPGYGMVESRRERKTKIYQLIVETDIGRIKIPTFYHPDALQIDIYLFRSPVISEQYLEVKDPNVAFVRTKLISEKEFQQFTPFAHEEVQKYGNHFLVPIIHTKERENNKVSGFIKILGSDHILVFTAKYSHINFGELVMDYQLRLRDLHQEINLNDISDDEFASDAE